jgi:hypothetical protein
MTDQNLYPACFICGKRRKKHKLVLGAIICKSCLKELDLLRLKPLEKYGQIKFESGSNFIHPFWIKARGELLESGNDPQIAVFSKKGFIKQTDNGELFLLKSGTRDFDHRVQTLSSTPDQTLRFLADPVVKQVIEFMTGNNGRLKIDGGLIELEMNGQFLHSTRQAFPIREEGQWAFGILFRKLADFSAPN